MASHHASVTIEPLARCIRSAKLTVSDRLSQGFLSQLRAGWLRAAALRCRPAHLALTDSGRTRFSKRFATEAATRMFYPHATRRPAIDAPKVAALLSRFAGTATRGHPGRQQLIQVKTD
jgi:hypothetical protein